MSGEKVIVREEGGERGSYEVRRIRERRKGQKMDGEKSVDHKYHSV